MLSSSKKAQFVDGIIFTISIFIIAVILLSYSYVFPKIAIAFNQSGISNSTEGQAAVTNLYEMGTSGINQGFLIFFAGLVLVQLASAFFVRYHPVFIIIFFAMIVTNGLLTVYLGNVFETLSSTTDLSTALADQPVMNYVMSNILVIVIVVDILSLFVLYAKIGEAQL